MGWTKDWKLVSDCHIMERQQVYSVGAAAWFLWLALRDLFCSGGAAMKTENEIFQQFEAFMKQRQTSKRYAIELSEQQLTMVEQCLVFACMNTKTINEHAKTPVDSFQLLDLILALTELREA